MKNPLRSRYDHIKERCYNQNAKSYPRYGGRGIVMCDEWLNDFSAFEKWCLENGYKPELQIDRIDNDGPYAPWNCRFATNKENSQHKGSTRYYTYIGETKNLSQWCSEIGIPFSTVCARIDRFGWSFDKAITTPVRKRDTKHLVGERFGRLTVLEYAKDYPHGKGRNSWWVCRCDCGDTVIVRDCKLVTGYTRSCGCLQKETNPNLGKRKSSAE